MYTQAMDTMPKEERSALEDAASQQRFDARIDAGDFIEAKDWMPEHSARRSCARSASMRTARSSACCPKATGSRARRR